MTSGLSSRARQRAMVAVVVLFAAIQGSVNGVSRLADVRGAGSDVAGWMVAADEATSFAAWLVCMAVIWRLVKLLRPPRLNWPIAFALHVAATVPVSLLHIGLMVLLREGIYALAGAEYDFAYGGIWNEMFYEYRKDAPVYGLLAIAFAGIQWVTKAPAVTAVEAPVLTVQDGTARHRIPIDSVDWVEAAGNYVAIHWQGRQVLHRSTLSALAGELGSGFARVHRSRLVRRSAIRTVETMPSGDFIVTLDTGVELRGSRRYRDAVG